MNYKRCAVRNKFKAEAIRMLANALSIETLSNLIDSETGKFLEDIADSLEEKVIMEFGGKPSYDSMSLEELLEMAFSFIEEEDMKKSISSVVLKFIRMDGIKIRDGSSPAWLNTSSACDAEATACGLYCLHDVMDEFMLEAFIHVVIEESDIQTAVRKAATKLLKEDGQTKEDYANWYEGTE